MADLDDELRAALAALDGRKLLRRRRVVAPLEGARLLVDGRPLLAFAGNDYLGLARHPALAEAARRSATEEGVGATASPLVGGHGPQHAALEEELARFIGLPRALYFVAGYPANAALLPALVGEGDALIADALNHASLIDGARLSRAQRHVVAHNDLAAFEQALQATRGARRRLVVCDAVFGMDGDLAPLPDLLALCERHDAWLFVDDAHGFGVLGEDGRGSLAQWGLAGERVTRRMIYMATLGKAAGVAGAFVAGSQTAVEWLMQKTRSYMFATGAPPMVAAALRASLPLIEADAWRRERLDQLRATLRSGLAGLPWAAPRSHAAIQPLIVGGNDEALRLMTSLEERGLWVPAIRPPTVPEGTARLRISLSALHTPDDVQRLCEALHALAARPVRSS